MSIQPKFSQGDVRKRYGKFIEAIEKKQIEKLQHLGEQCVLHARQVPGDVGFFDKTGNLRSSIGCAIFKNGVAIHENFTPVLEGSEGAKTGQALARRVGAKYTEGIALVVTAGMNYAVCLESKGRDVLTSAESLAKQELPKLVEELKKNINRALSE